MDCGRFAWEFIELCSGSVCLICHEVMCCVIDSSQNFIGFIVFGYVLTGNLLPPMATTRGPPTTSREGSSARVGGDALPIVGNLGGWVTLTHYVGPHSSSPSSGGTVPGLR